MTIFVIAWGPSEFVKLYETEESAENQNIFFIHILRVYSYSGYWMSYMYSTTGLALSI